MRKVSIARFDDLEDRKPAHALVEGVDLVVIRYDDKVSALYGRCLHRGAILADGHVDGDNLICGLHFWDYRIDSGVSEYNNHEVLHKFDAWIEDNADGRAVTVDADQVAAWAVDNPQPYDRDSYLGAYQDVHGTPEEPFVGLIQGYAKDGLSKTGHHGVVEAMGVPRDQVPTWDDIQVLTAQLHRAPLLDNAAVGTGVTIGPNAQKPLRLDLSLIHI